MENVTQNPTPNTTKEEYFFSGGLQFVPTTVLASSPEEAEAEWKKVRVPVEPAEPQPTPKTQSTPAPKSTSK